MGFGWRTVFDSVLYIDPAKHELGGRFVEIWCLAMEALGQGMAMFIPDQAELSQFLEYVKCDIRNKEYQLYAELYLLNRYQAINVRYVVVGTKADATEGVTGSTDLD